MSCIGDLPTRTWKAGGAVQHSHHYLSLNVTSQSSAASPHKAKASSQLQLNSWLSFYLSPNVQYVRGLAWPERPGE